jgi:uncharacterized protein YggE
MSITVTSRKLVLLVVAAIALLVAYLLGSARPGVAAAAPLAPIVPAATTTATSTSGITVAGSGIVSGTPDTLRLNLGVTASASDIDAALNSANAAALAVQRSLTARGVEAKDMQTTGMSVQQDYDSKGRPNGYRVDETLTVTLHDLTKAGATMSAAVNAGGNHVRVDGVSLSLADTTALVSGARTRAIEDAHAKAASYAAAAGRSLGAVVSISENVSQPTPIAYDGRTALTFAAQASPVPLQAGSQDVTVDVVVVYAFG